MNGIQLLLNTEEKEVLVRLLEREIRQELVEEHRTRAPSYRELIQHDEALLQGVLRKLTEATAPAEAVR